MSLMAIGTSIAGAVSGAIGANNSNKAQLKIAREANAHNLKLYKMQVKDTERLWQKTNEYNTPKNQRDRFTNAGINPYFALGEMNSGTAGAMTTPSPQGAVSPAVYSEPLQHVSQGFNNVSQLALQSAQIEQIRANTDLIKSKTKESNITNSFLSDDYKKRIEGMDLDIQQKRYLLDRSNFEFNEFKDLTDDRKKLFREQVNHAVKLNESLGIDNALKDLDLKQFKPFELQQLKNSIKISLAQLAQMAETRELTRAQRMLVLAQKAKTDLEAKGIHISNSLALDTYEWMVENAEFDNWIKQYDATYGLESRTQEHNQRMNSEQAKEEWQRLENKNYYTNKMVMPALQSLGIGSFLVGFLK